jgi:UDP-glucose 4-epimerase
MNILVTGGAGYIGSHTCKHLNLYRLIPIVFDNLFFGHKDFVRWSPLEIGDLIKIDDLRRVFHQYKLEAVVHFAAFAYVGESVLNPEKYYYNNFYGTLNLLKVMREFNVNKIVFSSSCATYGIPISVPIDEIQQQNPINPYGFTKLAIERVLKDYDVAYGLKSVSLRYFNAAGADGEIGEKHDPETHVIPLIIQAAQKKIPHINIYGTDYQTPDKTAIRDYIHVNDLAHAHYLALKYLLNGGQTDQFNLGTGIGHSILELISIVKKVSGKDITINTCDRRPGDPPVLVANNEKVEKILDWKPEYDINEIISSAWNWHENN